MPLRRFAMSFFAFAMLRVVAPCHRLALLCFTFALLYRAMPLLCLAGLAVALQLRSGRIRRSAKLSAAPHFLSHASQRPGGADLRDASATPCYAVAFPSRPMPLRFRSAHSYAIAFPSCPMPPQISSVLCLRISAPCHGRSVLCDSLAGPRSAAADQLRAVPLRLRAVPLRLRAKLCPCSADLRRAVPQRL